MRATLEGQKQLALAVLDYYENVLKPTILNPKDTFKIERLDDTWSGDRYVTSADRVGHEMLSAATQKVFGDDVEVYSEAESGTQQNDTEFEKLAQMMARSKKGIIGLDDPTDGNSNVVRHVQAVLNGENSEGFPCVGVITSLIEQGEVTASCILADDGAGPKIAMAVKGQGAYFLDVQTHEMTRISFAPAKDKPVAAMTLVPSWNSECQGNINAAVAAGALTLHPKTPKSAAHEWMIGLLDGVNPDADADTVVPFRKNGSQDQAGGALIWTEAGGFAKTLNGFDPIEAPWCDGVLAAKTKEQFDEVRAMILGDKDTYELSWGPKEIEKGYTTSNHQLKARLDKRVAELTM